MTAAAETRSAKLARLQVEKDAREAARAEALLDSQIELMEKEAECEASLGPRGQQFEIVDVRSLGEGFIVVKLGEGVLHTKFTASKMTPADLDAYVVPCLFYPDASKYRAIVERRHGVALQCATALAKLFGVRIKEDEGK